MTIKQVLSGHTSFETGYLVDSYPYGRLRCRKWYWIETAEKKGVRFVGQTENPKNGQMNAPKKGTYIRISGCMFLDENDHVQFKGISEYDSAERVQAFLQDFASGLTDDAILTLRAWALGKAAYCKVLLDRETREGEREDREKELAIWKAIVKDYKKP